MKLDFLQKQTSRRDILRGSVTLAGSAVPALKRYRTLRLCGESLHSNKPNSRS